MLFPLYKSSVCSGILTSILISAPNACCSCFAPFCEEPLQLSSSLLRKNTAGKLHVMVKPKPRSQIDYASACTCLGIRCAIDQPGNACVKHCSQAHDAWFQRDI